MLYVLRKVSILCLSVGSREICGFFYVNYRVADPKQLISDLDPIFQLITDPDPTFHVISDPDPILIRRIFFYEKKSKFSKI